MAEDIHERDIAMLESGQESFFDEHATTTPGGEMRASSRRRACRCMADGKPRYIISVLHDVTQRKRDEARISYMAHHDSMTDLPNRASFNECLNGMFDLAETGGHQLSPCCAWTSTASRPSTTRSGVHRRCGSQAAGRAPRGGLRRRVSGPRRRRRILRDFADRRAAGDADALAARLREVTAATSTSTATRSASA